MPLLIENNLLKYADRVLVIDTQPDIQFNQILHRDNINQKIAEKILLSQTSRQLRLKFANDVIDHNLTHNEITQLIYTLYQIYMNIYYNNYQKHHFCLKKFFNLKL